MAKGRKNFRARLSSYTDLSLPEKANRVLNLILILLLLLTLRIWHLSVVQHDKRMDEFRKPQRRVVVEPSRRATIRDRYNIPLALNRIQYKVFVQYSQFRQIPAIEWITDTDGKRVKKLKRKEYISNLAKLLGEELHLEGERLEDLIYSKAAFYYQIPYLIKEDLTEREYFRLKMLEKDWPGIHVQAFPKRVYPQGRVGADIIGYMGAIDRKEYEGIIREIKALEEYLQAYDNAEEAFPPAGIETPVEARTRLKELSERAYTTADYVGKYGIEGRFEEQLRGFQGKKIYHADARGNFLCELPGSRRPLPGKRVLLSISAELQQYAETLLMQNERIRDAYLSHPDPITHSTKSKQPWIKGGAIIAMDPHSGEVLALASYPRFDPNDFIASGDPEQAVKQRLQIGRWFESEGYIEKIWDQRIPLERERYDDEREEAYEEEVVLSWEKYLDFILPEESDLRTALIRINTIKQAIDLLESAESLLQLSNQKNLHWVMQVLYPDDSHKIYGKKVPLDQKQAIAMQFKIHEMEAKRFKERIDQHLKPLSAHYDKVLLLDLCRLVVNRDSFSPTLIATAGSQSLSYYRNSSAAMAVLEPIVRGMAKELFHETDFKSWRQNNGKEFLKQKRQEEKVAMVRYPKPYLDYIDEQEELLFRQFWHQERWNLIITFLLGNQDKTTVNLYGTTLDCWHRELEAGAHPKVVWKEAYQTLQSAIKKIDKTERSSYLASLRSFKDLQRPLWGSYRHLRKDAKGGQLEKHLAAGFYPKYGFGYSRSHAFRQATTQGSIFKLITAYEALVQRHRQLDPQKLTKTSLNPLKIVDSWQKIGNETIVGHHSDGRSIPQHYKGGRLVKSQIKNIGEIDIVRAIEYSSNPYFGLLAGEHLSSPLDLALAARKFSFGARTGIDLQAEIPGRIPTDLETNKTGLYSMAIGQHSLVVTPLQTTVALCAIANGGKVMKPKIVNMMIGAKVDEEGVVIPALPSFDYQESLASVGIDFPLFIASCTKAAENRVERIPNRIRRTLFMPAIVRSILLDGMQRSIAKISHHGLNSLSKLYQDYPEAISDYVELENHLVGKSSTAEAIENIDLDLTHGSNLYTHIWFGSIAFTGAQENYKQFIYRDAKGYPELVVIVYLRFGHFGRDAVPLSAQIIKKWREIKQKHDRKDLIDEI